jgi:tRNA(Ile2)-agmatinylcytidine synthase
MRCLIGVDDTDSQFGRCTTHLGFQMVRALRKKGCLFGTYPRLVRLNPNIPFKTRGNAAVCIEFECGDPDVAFEVAQSLLLKNADVENGANSGLVFLDRPPAPLFRKTYSEALSGLLNHRKVLRNLIQERVKYSTLGNGMGVVGAAASIGFAPSDDHTYELIAYRSPRMCGRPRVVDASSVKSMERATFPHTFNSFDHQTDRVLITPHGPDPVFLGIRADSPEVALRAFRMVEYDERLAGHLIYLSNQCTDAHLSARLSVPPKAYYCGWAEGTVQAVATGEGGHLYLDLDVGAGQTLGCAVYEPAHDLRNMAGAIAVGDRIRAFGGIRRPSSRHPPTLNVEKVEVLSLAPSFRLVSPTCKLCGRRMKSEGAGKGFECRVCGRRSRARSKSIVRSERRLVPGIYLPSPGSQRHLTKQLIRYGNELSTVHALVDGWWDDATTVRSLPTPVRNHR